MRKLGLFSIGFILGVLAYCVLSLALMQTAEARDWVLGLDELSVDYNNHAVLNKNQRDPLLYPESPKEKLNVNINTDLFQVIGWDSKIESTTTDSQYRAVGLQTALYLRITQSLEGGYMHHSQHLLDRNSATLPAFPSEDALTIKLYLFRARPGRDSLF